MHGVSCRRHGLADPLSIKAATQERVIARVKRPEQTEVLPSEIATRRKGSGNPSPAAIDADFDKRNTRFRPSPPFDRHRLACQERRVRGG